MPRITFLRDEVYETEGPKKGPLFATGDRLDCTEDFAERWVRRGAAEITGKGEPKDGERYTRVRGKAEIEAPRTSSEQPPVETAAAAAPAAAAQAAPQLPLQAKA